MATTNLPDIEREAPRAEVQEPRQRLERLEAAVCPLTSGDRARLARLLPVIGAAFGSESFTVPVSDNAGLRLTLTGVSAKRLGRLFARANDIAMDVVERLGVEDHAVIWRRRSF